MELATAPRTRAEQDRALFLQMHDPSSPVDRQIVAERFLPLARSVARRHTYHHEGVDDILQVACLGLVKAIDRYDVDRDVAFSSYAVPTMTGEIKRYYRDRTWAVRPPRSLQDLAVALEAEIERWTSRHGASPTVAEMAERLDADEEDVLEAMHVQSARTPTSLDAPAGDPSDPRASIGDVTGTDDPGYEEAEADESVSWLLDHLPRRDRDIVRLRIEQGLTQAEIGAIHGLSQMQVSRILQAAMTRLRTVAERHLRAGAG